MARQLGRQLWAVRRGPKFLDNRLSELLGRTSGRSEAIGAVEGCGLDNERRARQGDSRRLGPV